MNKEKKIKNENMAKAVLRDTSISTKMAVEVCSFIRNKRLEKAKDMLEKVVDKKQAVPIKRYNKGLAHKKKIGPGRYPIKVSKEILKLLDQVEANAQFKGLNTTDLVISHIKADKASTPWHYGRKRRRKMKRTHVEIIVKEKIEKEKKKVEEKEKKEDIKEEKVEEKKKTMQEPKEEIKEDKEKGKTEEKPKEEKKETKEEKKADKK